jgi:hypothetical protein
MQCQFEGCEQGRTILHQKLTPSGYSTFRTLVCDLASCSVIGFQTCFLYTVGRDGDQPGMAIHHINRRRVSGAKTPPRSLSPSKKQAQGLTESNYVDTFPPSRRPTLAALGLQPSDERPNWSNNMVPMETSYTDAEDSMYMPCGFSVKEIKALGDFPDYSRLSGVPLPTPYTNFDIHKALPRPYRPFRWAYHQTMCR